MNTASSKPSFSVIKIISISFLYVALIVLLILASYFIPAQFATALEAPNTTQQVAVSKPVVESDFTVNQQFNGLVEAKKVSQLGFELGGLLEQVLVEEGQHVEKGQVLATLSQQLMRSKIDELAANLSKYTADVELAKINVARSKKALKSHSIATQVYDEAVQKLASSKAQKNLALAQMNSAKVQLNQATLYAPFNGVVLNKLVNVGNVIGAGQTIVTLQENAQYRVRVGINMNAADRVNIGDTYMLTIHGKQYPAILEAVLPARSISRSIDALFTLQQVDKTLRAGDLAKFNMDKLVQQQGYWLPIASLQEGKRGVWSIFIIDLSSQNTIVKRRFIDVEYSSEERAYIRGTLPDNYVVVTKGGHKLVPNQQVSIVEH